MKILFVCSSKSSSVGHSSYTHRVIQIERYCRKLGADTDLLFLGDLFFSSPTLVQPLNLPFVLRFLRKFDIIHAGSCGPAYFLALVKPLIAPNTLVVYDVHGDVYTESRLASKGPLDLAGYFSGWQMRFAEYFAFNGADYFIAASRRIKQRLLARKKRIKTEDIEVVLNGVDLETFQPQKIKPDMQTRSFVVTYAGSFRPWQGIENLVRAAEILADEDVQFKLIGFGKDDSLVKEDIRKRLGEKANLIDWLPKTALIVALQESDVLIVPADASSSKQSKSRVATYATKIAEFIAIAKPIIVTRLEEAAELIERFDCGFVCEPTADSIADTIRKAKETPREVLIKKGLNGRRCAEAELDMNSICKGYLGFLRRILEARSLK